jgi:hypothetical protein
LSFALLSERQLMLVRLLERKGALKPTPTEPPFPREIGAEPSESPAVLKQLQALSAAVREENRGEGVGHAVSFERLLALRARLMRLTR